MDGMGDGMASSGGNWTVWFLVEDIGWYGF
jgi:hypothetical protein